MANNTFTQNNQLQIAFKKLLGKAHTNPNFEFFNENFATSVQIANKNVFGQNIPSLASTPANYTTSSNSAGEVTVETVPFTLTGIDASQYDAVEGSVSNTTIDDQTTDNSENSSQIHTFKLVLASDYVSTSNNPISGSDPFTNSRIVADTTGALQIIPESFGVGYAPIVKDSSGNTIGALDNENYLLDPFNGILFVQDQDGGSNFKVPASVTASIYIGSYADTVSALPDGVLSSSIQIGDDISGSFLLNTTDEFTGKLTVTGDISASGDITASNGTFEGGVIRANTNSENYIKGSLAFKGGAQSYRAALIARGGAGGFGDHSPSSGPGQGSVGDIGTNDLVISTNNLNNLFIFKGGDNNSGGALIISGGNSPISGSPSLDVRGPITSSTDISASGDIFATNIHAVGDVIAQRYIVSSSVSFITQSFSSGSTIFGDTLDDTHQITGSLSITGSSTTGERTPLVITEDGEVQIANADFVTSGDVGQYELDISSSGDNTGISITNTEVLIISGAGGLDVTSNTDTLTLTIGGGIVSGSAQILSGSGVISGAAQIAEIGHATASISSLVTSASLFALTSSIIGTDNQIKITANDPQGVRIGLTPSISVENNITASGEISASGHLFASLSLDNNNHKTVMYDTASGQFFFTGSYGGDGGGGFSLIRLNGDNGSEVINDGDTITIAGGTNINTIAGSTDTVTVNLNHSIFLSGSGLFLSGGQHDYGNQTDIDATSGFRVDNDKAYTHVTPQFYRDKYAILGVPFKARFSVAEFPNNYLVMGPHGLFVNSGHSGTDPTVDEPGKALIVGGGDNAGVGVIQVRGDLEIVPTQSVDGGTTSGIRIAAGNPTGSFNPGIFFYDRDNKSTTSGSFFYSSASAEIRFDTGSKAVKFLAGSTTEDLKEVLHVSKSGDNPRIGIGLSNPIKAFDFKEVRDDNKGGEILIRGSRSTKGAENNDEVGRINFAIDSSSFVKIDTSGSAAEIVAIVDDIDTTGVEGSLSLRVASTKTAGSVQRIKLIGNPNSPAVEITGSTEFDTDVTIGNDLTVNNDLTVSDYALINGLRVGSTDTDPGAGRIITEDYGSFTGGVNIGSFEDPGTSNLIVKGTTTTKGAVQLSGSSLTLPTLTTQATVETTNTVLILDDGTVKQAAQTSMPYISIHEGVVPGGSSNQLLMFSGSTGTKKVKVAPGVTHNAALGYVFSGAGTTTDIFADNMFIGLITASGNISASGTITAATLDAAAVSDTLAAAIVAEIDNDEIPVAKLAEDSISGVTLGGDLNNLTVDDATLQLNSGTTFNGSAARTISIKDGGVDSDALAANILVTQLTSSIISASGTVTADSFTGNGLSIDGSSNSHIEVGEYNVGFDTVGSNTLFITGSGLIVSGAMADQNHHNMVKIGNVELLDVTTLLSQNEFLIHNVSSFKITSGSDGGDIAGTAGRLFEHNGTDFKLYRNNSEVIGVDATTTTFNNTNVSFVATPFFRAAVTDPSSNGHFLYTTADPGSSPQETKAVNVGDVFKVLTGAVTASAVSASGTITAATLDAAAVSDTLAAAIVAEIDNDEIPIAKLAEDSISGVALGSNLNNLTVDNATLQLNSGTTYNGSAARTISIKDGGVDSDALAANISVTQITASAAEITTNKLAKTSNTDADHQGDVVFFGGTTSMTAGRIYHYNSSGNWELSNATDNTKSTGLLAVALGTASDTDGMLLKGMVTLDHDPGAVGDKLFLRTADGLANAIVASSTGNVIRVIGYCLDASNGQIYFNPSNDHIVHA